MAPTPASVRMARPPPLRRFAAAVLSWSRVELSGLAPDERAAPAGDARAPPNGGGGGGSGGGARVGALPEGGEAARGVDPTGGVDEVPVGEKRWLHGRPSARGRGESSPRSFIEIDPRGPSPRAIARSSANS